MKKHLLFLGAPGAGKGTQAELLSKTYSYLHLSTGELLRKEIDLGTNLGKQVKDIMNKGQLVSDQLVLEIVKKNLDINRNSNYNYLYKKHSNRLNQILKLIKTL